MGICSNRQEQKQISENLRLKAIMIFQKIDVQNKGYIDKERTLQFWKSNFAKINTDALFSQVDYNKSGNITIQEWLAFWDIVKQQGYSEQEISDELDELQQGKAWVQYYKVDAFIRSDTQRHKTQIDQIVQMEKKTLLKSKSFNYN
ncbi:unnamed protein product [Paramecium pentaurelia]|uniref:EF-hand domain-containing protein n=1 Tax=Paramecium pentaurelia TaxID=43138 RepID=A0A8S1U1K1_9CILI|nr:unnamed protein product [Paramecium pentaurelia]